MAINREPILRLLVFSLASTSFACLIGTFYGWWNMKPFACYLYLPAIVLLAVLAKGIRTRDIAGGTAANATTEQMGAAILAELKALA